MIAPQPTRRLDWLLHPVCADEFLRSSFEHVPLVVSRKRPDYYASFFALSDLDRLLALIDPNTDAIRVIKDGRTQAMGRQGWSANQVGRGVERVYAAYRDGSTIVVQGIHDRWPSLIDLSHELARELAYNFQVNAYLTPPRSRGLGTHFDVHDAIVLQIHGTKRWRIYEAEMSAPLDHHSRIADHVSSPRLRQEVVLTPGDLLYLPRGFPHDAQTPAETETASLHLTIGIRTFKWIDYLTTALNEAAESDAFWRQSLPPNFAGDAEVRKLAQEELKRKLVTLAEWPLQRTLENLAERVYSQQNPSLLSHLLDLEKSTTLELATELRRRRGLLAHTTAESDHKIIAFHGKQLRLPDRITPLLRYVDDHEVFRVSDLPDSFDDESKLTFARFLLREGYLTVVKSDS